MLGFLMMLESDADRALLAAIYEDTLPNLQRAGLRILPQHPDWVEDAIASVFAEVAGRFEALRDMPRQEWPPYLTVAVKNRCRTRLRQEGRFEALEEARWAVAPNTDGLGEDYALAVQAIYKLEEIYREVLECRLVLGWSNGEVAARLHVSEGTASQRFQRARALVTQTLREEGVCCG